MVTVIANKEELSTPVHNGVTAGSHDHERTFQYIKDYQEVDFHRSPSCKLLPEDLFGSDSDPRSKSSIKGSFFVQIDSIELVTSSVNNKTNLNQPSEQNNHINSLLLTLTDGITTVKGVTNDFIPNLSCNIRPGSKLLLTGLIYIKDDLLQLTHDNTRFQYGSNTYPRPKSAYRGRGGGSYRPSYEGRRGGAGNSNSRYDNDDSTSNFLKGPPPKQTLKDFMTSLKISNDIQSTTIDNDNRKSKDCHENKRRNTEQYHQTNKTANSINSTSDSIHHYPSNNDNNNDQLACSQDGNLEQIDPEDDSSHPNYRERRNPLPPRLQRAQEERTRRSTTRYYDEQMSTTGSDMNGNYRNGASNNNPMSSASSYSRRGDNTFCIGMNNPSNCSPHTAAMNTYGSHGNMLGPAIGTTPSHLAFFPTNAGPLPYGIGSIPNSPFHTQPPPISPGYINDSLGICYRHSFVNPPYPSHTAVNGVNEDDKDGDTTSDLQTSSIVDGNEIKTSNESQDDDNNNNANNDETQPQSLSVEQKVTSSATSPCSSSNDASSSFQQIMVEQSEDKRRDSNSNSGIRWKIGDMCLARWSEDQEFYAATIVHIQSSYCTVLFRDYNNYDKVHFSDLKILPRDQQYYPYVPSMAGPTSDSNILVPNVYYPSRTNYYPPTIDGCIIMPEPPPFPFNSAGTLCMYPPTMASVSRSNRYQTNGLAPFQQPPNRRFENGFMTNNHRFIVDTTMDSSSTQSKESNDTSMIDSASTSMDDNQRLQKEDTSLPTKEHRSCSIADASIRLTTSDDERGHSTSTESLTSSKFDEQQMTNEAEKQESNSPMVDAN